MRAEEIIERRKVASFAVHHLRQNMEEDSFLELVACFLADRGLTDEFRRESRFAPVHQPDERD